MSRRASLGARADAGITLRTPLLPLDGLLSWAGRGHDLAAARSWLGRTLELPVVREAIFVGSPGLWQTLERWRRDPESPAGRAAEGALVKYVARMSGRATPFGLFAGVSAGSLAARTELALGPRDEYRRHTRLDNDYLFALAAALARDPVVRRQLRHRPNGSLYEVAGQLRYAEAYLDDRRRYRLVALEPASYLLATLARARAGARLGDLAAGLVADDAEITMEEASAYLDELVDSQILVSDLGVMVTGRDPLDALTAELAAMASSGESAEPVRHALQVLGEVRARLRDTDRTPLGGAEATYQGLAATLSGLPVELETSRLVQIDLVKPARATLSRRIAAEVARALDWLRQISRPSEPTALEDFRRAFSERYAGREMPLAQVLDDEAGIGFESRAWPGSEASPLLAGLAFAGAAREGDARWGRVEGHLGRRLAGALARDDQEIVLDDADLAAMRADPAPGSPEAFGAIIRLGGTAEQLERGEGAILLEGAHGPSGAALLGRFCHASPDIEAMVRAHLAAEEALRPQAIFAEIVHLPDGRLGNIMCRPVLRGHEIPFLGLSSASPEQTIALDDLFVSVVGERIVLRSHRLQREIVPRLTTAHNFRRASLGCYRFLCALQGQGGTSAGAWSWGALAGMPRLPRVRLGRVVVARATWNLIASDHAELTSALRQGSGRRGPAPPERGRDERVASLVAGLRARFGLPRWLVVVSGDNELPVDLDNPLLVRAFAEEVVRTGHATLRELFPLPEALAVRGPEGGFANEIVLTFVRAARPAADDPPAAARPSGTAAVERSFPPGSTWLYVKLYAGEATADRVLRAVVGPVARAAIARGDVTHWFFVRYDEGRGPHLRVRFAGPSDRLLGSVLPALTRAVDPLRRRGAVRRMELDTYEREIERYGGDAGIEACERWFWIDSETVLDVVEGLSGDRAAHARWRLALRGSDQLAADLGLDPAARAGFFAIARDQAATRFGSHAELYASIGDRYRKEQADVETCLERAAVAGSAHELAAMLDLFEARSRRLSPIADALRARDREGRLGTSLSDLALSLVHMQNNRLLHASQPAQEVVLYDFLRRYHESRLARGRVGSG